MTGDKSKSPDAEKGSEGRPFQGPGALLRARAEAFDRGDFRLIYDSYHPESLFRQQFPERDAYLSYAREQLAGEFRIIGCRILRESVETHQARVISLLEFRQQEITLYLLELTLLLPVAGEWRVHSAQKQTPDDFACPPEEVDFEDFARISPAVIF